MRQSFALLVLIVLFGCTHLVFSQSVSSQDRDRGVIMLKAVRDDIRKYYYDPAFRGIDLDARTKAAEERIKQAKSNGEIFGVIAQLLLDFNDSHTIFLPPQRSARVEYGWQMQSFGDDCYVIAVKPKSDAEAKGLKPGDKVIKVDGVAPNRANLWIYQYLYTALSPRPVVNMEVQTAGEQPRQLEVKAKVQTGRQVRDLTDTIDLNAYWREQTDEAHLNDHIFYEVGKDTIIWRMPTFDLENDAVDERIDKVKKYKALIIDLRRNAGGAVETLQRLVGNLFDRDVTIGDMKLRKESKPMLARTRGDSGFKGQVIVLVDSGSNSASEVFARVMQLEKRGTVIGDRTGGKVMRSRLYSHQIGLDTVVYYGVSVTDADLIMADGKTLEGTGVTPDELVLPAPDDLRAQKDSVLARAVAIAGGTIDPVEAGKLFPFKWKP